MKKILLYLPVLLTAFGLLFSFQPALANDYGLQKTGDAAGLTTAVDLPARLGSVMNAALGLLGLIFLILAVYGGFVIMLSQGEQGKVTTGKNTLLYAVIGMIVVASAYAITSFVITRVVK